MYYIDGIICRVKCTYFEMCPRKSLHFYTRDAPMYRGKDRQVLPLFSELFPFGGKLDSENRWLKIAKLIPWNEIECKYKRFFSERGRPSLDSRLVIGILLLKHMTGFSDDDILGKKYFAELERKTYEVLIERKIIKGKGVLLDATVFPEYVRYPTDTGLLNEAREWTVSQIKSLGNSLGKKLRTYCRKARKEYLNFSKKKSRSRKLIQKTKKSLLQYLRRNVKQMQSLVDEAVQQGVKIKKKVLDRFDVVRTVLDQQFEMYREKKNRIDDRIVSLHRPWTRPIVRGKSGDKKVEFGPKAALSYVDGFVFLDHISSDNFAEAALVNTQIEHYESLFGHKPPYATADKIYGNRENRKLLKKNEIRDAFEPLGRKARKKNPADRWRKQKQRERNRIEGSFGHGKNHFDLDKTKYYIEDGPEIWVRLGLLSMNLQTAVKRI